MPIHLIPVIKKKMADTITPISLFNNLKLKGAKILLESVEKGERWGRYSMIALNPEGEVIIKNNEVKLSGCLADLKLEGRPDFIINSILDMYKIDDAEGMPPFIGGLAGYFSYDTIRYYEELPQKVNDDTGFPDVHFMLIMDVVVYDHLKNTVIAIKLIPSEEATPDNIKKIENKLEILIDDMSLKALDQPEKVTGYLEMQTNMTRDQYENGVRIIKKYIYEGDIFQCVLSQRISYKPAPHPFSVYRRLRTINPSPYMYYLDMGDCQIVGSSPECLTNVEGDMVETFPIAGTRKRGDSDAEDKALAEDLINDEKELAEHAMLVDLGRNDIGRISKFGSVNVEDYMHIEYFSHVMHIVSRVTGRLADDKKPIDALMACLPAGTVSGAPKIRAMEIIEDLEPTRRGPYAGAVGYFDFRGNMDTCITIRTLFFKDGVVHTQAGAGIVADSIPDKEYDETINKLMALTSALGVGKDMIIKKAAEGVKN